MRTLKIFLLAALALAAIPSHAAAPARQDRGPALVKVEAETPEQLRALLSSGLDLAESRHGHHYDVVLWPGDEAKLRDLGLSFRVAIADLLEHDRRLAAEDRTTSASTRTTYRRLPEFEAELKALAETYPGHVRLIEAPHKTLEGRTVYGVEIAENVTRRDGRPTSFIMGLHHAREWPAAELPMDFAVELATKYGTDTRITTLLRNVRVLILPIVNPDGFNHSREFIIDGPSQLGIVAGGQGSYWRKNRRGAAHAPGASVGSYGVDPNRNYAYLWGSGTVDPSSTTSAIPVDQTYQGVAPFSEAESQNVRELVLGRNVVTLLTNHTYGRLVLYPWGYTRTAAPDRTVLRELALSMASTNGYSAQTGYDLYPTTGTTEDWSYATTGGLGYTFELGTVFHPSYSAVRTLYSSNREAFLRLAEAANTPRYHSILTGTVTDAAGAPVRATLRLTKTSQTPVNPRVTSIYQPTTDTLDISMVAAEDGTFTWHVNPSTRPIATQTESYLLTVSAEGSAAVSRSVVVARGQTLNLGTIALG